MLLCEACVFVVEPLGEAESETAGDDFTTNDGESSGGEGEGESTGESSTGEGEGESTGESSTEEGEGESTGESSTGPVFTCGDLEADYEGLVSMSQCDVDSDCKIVEGHCGVGIGGCYHAVNQSVDPNDLAELAQLYVELDCTSLICDCPETPASALCVEGTCEPLF